MNCTQITFIWIIMYTKYCHIIYNGNQLPHYRLGQKCTKLIVGNSCSVLWVNENLNQGCKFHSLSSNTMDVSLTKLGKAKYNFIQI